MLYLTYSKLVQVNAVLRVDSTYRLDRQADIIDLLRSGTCNRRHI